MNSSSAFSNMREKSMKTTFLPCKSAIFLAIIYVKSEKVNQRKTKTLISPQSGHSAHQNEMIGKNNLPLRLLISIPALLLP